MLFGGFDAALFQFQSDGLLQTVQPAPKLHPVGLSENIGGKPETHGLP